MAYKPASYTQDLGRDLPDCRGGFAVGELQFEQPEDFLAGQALALDRRGRRVEYRVKQLSLFLQHAIDPLFDRAHGQKSRHRHRTGDAEAMRPMDGPILDGRVPLIFLKPTFLRNSSDRFFVHIFLANLYCHAAQAHKYATYKHQSHGPANGIDKIFVCEIAQIANH